MTERVRCSVDMCGDSYPSDSKIMHFIKEKNKIIPMCGYCVSYYLGDKHGECSCND